MAKVSGMERAGVGAAACAHAATIPKQPAMTTRTHAACFTRGALVKESTLMRSIRCVRRQLMQLVEQVERITRAQLVRIKLAKPVERGMRRRFDGFIILAGDVGCTNDTHRRRC